MIVVDVIVKFDTACSRNMSGNSGRIVPDTMLIKNVSIKGFNGSVSTPSAIGRNEDNKMEYFVQSMPHNLALLCAQDYVTDGAAILFPNDGQVIRMSSEEREALRDYIAAFPTIKRLVVRNRTYEVDSDDVDSNCSVVQENAFTSTATRYFNSKVHISNSQERVLATLLTGLSFQDIYAMVKNSNIDGLPRDLAMKALNKFEHNYGRTPDVLQLATPNLAGNHKGYMAPPVPITFIGQRVEADYFETEFNEEVTETITKEGMTTTKTHVKKLASHGNALACFVSIDVFSGKVHGRLVPSMKHSLDHVQYVIESYKRDGHQVQVFAADQGVLSQAMFKIVTPEVDKYLLQQQVKAEISEPYTHNNGSTHVERVIRTIQELMRFAMLYVLKNPNFPSFGFTKKQIMKCWGNISLWSINLVNLQPCVHAPPKTKYEVYHNERPDLRQIRLLRRTANKELNSTREFWQKGLYIGPSIETPGAINAIVLTRGKLKVITTTAIKSISDRGSLDPHKIVSRALPSLIQEHDNPIIDDHISHTEDADALSNNALHPSFSPVQPAVERPTTTVLIVPSTTIDAPTITAVQKRHRKKKINQSSPPPSVPGICTSPFSRIESVKVRGNVAERDANRYQLLICSWKNRSTSTSMASRLQSVANSAMDHTTTLQLDLTALNNEKQAISGEALVEQCSFVDWSTHKEESYYLSFATNMYIIINTNKSSEEETESTVNWTTSEDSYKAVTENIPKNFTAALRDPTWGEPARIEFDTIVVDTKAVVEINSDKAKAHIDNGAEILRMIPVYEEKIKNGKLVRKLRLVADGRNHIKHGNTYSPTPSREELFDDFIFGGTNNEITLRKLTDFRAIVRATDPEVNGHRILGMELSRDRERRIVMLTMKERIMNWGKQYPESIVKKRNVPMPKSGYLVKDYELEALPSSMSALLDKKGIEKYMSIVSCLIWIQGVRMDIIFAVLYLSWYTKKPRKHHLIMAEYCIGYLYTTMEHPLVLDGPSEIRITGYTDASLTTGPNSRSITGQIIKLNDQSGAIYAKTKAGHQVLLSSFEGKLDSATNMIKNIARVSNVSNTADEMQIQVTKHSLAYTDNDTMMKFVKGKGVAKGVRHKEMRMWYVRDEYSKGGVTLHHMNGVKIPTDKLTKLGTAEEHRVFRTSILGHDLLDATYLTQLYN